jgi:hypothetical protein
MHVLCGRNDVEVAGQHQRFFRFKSLLRIFKKSRHPFEFIWIFLGFWWVAVGQVKTGDPKHALLQCDDALQKTGVDIFVVAGKARPGLIEGQLRQQRHPVERLLAVGDHVVAERFDRLARKGLIDAFDFLQANDIGRAVLQPAHEVVAALPDRIDVPRRNTHEFKVLRSKSWCRSRRTRWHSD